jgi:hypothetical protein
MEVAHRGGQSTEGGDSGPHGAVGRTGPCLHLCIVWPGQGCNSGRASILFRALLRIPRIAGIRRRVGRVQGSRSDARSTRRFSARS